VSRVPKPPFDELVGLRGAYALIIRVPRPARVRVGELGLLAFEPGIWVYVGSAMGSGSTSLGHRLRRHFSRSKKKHWHIDHLLGSAARVIDARWIVSDVPLECAAVSQLIESGRFEPGPRGFGASDCRHGCGTHLLRCVDRS